MQREIKFRGKRIDNGDWICGFYYEYSNKHIICWQNHSDNATTDHFGEVLPETVGQITGLTDKNGKEIYEGDVILVYNNPHAVTFSDGAFYLTYKNSNVRLSRTCGVLKIIGNIHDNQEILK